MFSKQTKTEKQHKFINFYWSFLAFIDNIAQMAKIFVQLHGPRKELTINHSEIKRNPSATHQYCSFNIYSFSQIARNKNTNKGKHWTIKAPYMNRRYMRLQHWYCSNYILHNWLPMYMYFSHSKATLSWTIQSIDIKWSNSLIMSIYKYVMPQ